MSARKDATFGGLDGLRNMFAAKAPAAKAAVKEDRMQSRGASDPGGSTAASKTEPPAVGRAQPKGESARAFPKAVSLSAVPGTTSNETIVKGLNKAFRGMDLKMDGGSDCQAIAHAYILCSLCCGMRETSEELRRLGAYASGEANRFKPGHFSRVVLALSGGRDDAEGLRAVGLELKKGGQLARPLHTSSKLRSLSKHLIFAESAQTVVDLMYAQAPGTAMLITIRGHVFSVICAEDAPVLMDCRLPGTMEAVPSDFPAWLAAFLKTTGIPRAAGVPDWDDGIIFVECFAAGTGVAEAPEFTLDACTATDIKAHPERYRGFVGLDFFWTRNFRSAAQLLSLGIRDPRGKAILEAERALDAWDDRRIALLPEGARPSPEIMPQLFGHMQALQPLREALRRARAMKSVWDA